MIDMRDLILEKQRRTYLADLLRKNGWEVYEEVYCDEKINGRSRFRLDIMARPPSFDHFIGFELKIYSGVRKGGEFFDALLQTLKYQGKSFRGYKIDMWCIDLFKKSNEEWEKDTFHSSWVFMQSFLQKAGVGMLDSHVYKGEYKSQDYERIVFMINDSAYIHLIGNKYGTNSTEWNKVYQRCIEKQIDIIQINKEVLNESGANN
jgi:hypothetical protein